MLNLQSKRIKSLIRAYYFSQQSHKSNLDVIYEMSKKAKTPFFTHQSHLVQIINDPLDFYLSIYTQIKSSIHRISLSSLYMGTDSLQRFLIQSMIKRAKSVPSLNITMLFDYNRSLRDQKGQSPHQMLSSYINSNNMGDRMKVAFHKQASSFSKVLGQVKGVHHQKIAVLDDTVIIGGANLSHNYFVNRKDRYMKIKECGELADYLHDYVSIMEENSYKLGKAGYPEENKEANLAEQYKLWRFSYCPKQYKQTLADQQAQITKLKIQKQQQQKALRTKTENVPKSRNIIISESLGTEIKQFEQIKLNEKEKTQMRENVRERMFNVHDENDVGNYLMDLERVYKNESNEQITQVGSKIYIFPFMQHPHLGQYLQYQTFQQVIQNSISNNHKIKISSGYLNFTPDLIKTLSKSQKPVQILCSAPQANSFYRAGRIKKYIPYYYRNVEGQMLERYPGKFVIKEYSDGKWSFHAKGVWIKQDEGEDRKEQDCYRYLTILGSSNYNKRSKERDTQLQLYIYSTCQKFNRRLDKQWQNIQKNCKQVSVEDIKKDQQIKYNFWTQNVFRFLSSIF